MPCYELSHVLDLFVLGVPSYRCRRYVSVAPKTAQRLFITFRQTMYHHSTGQLQQMFLSGEIEMDESMYGGHQKRK